MSSYLSTYLTYLPMDHELHMQILQATDDFPYVKSKLQRMKILEKCDL